MDNQTLTPLQVVTAQDLADGLDDVFVAKEHGISFTTLLQWKQRTDFQALILKAIQQNEAHAYREILAMKPMAVNRLKEMLNSKDSRIALKAAELILSFGI